MLTPLLEDDPRQVGPYRLQNRIGAGGMGTVYLGFAPDQRAVAVKVAAEELAEDAEFRRRFEREVHAALRVRGHAVAAVLDADTDAPAPWMVTEYVEGISLAEAVRARGRLERHLVRGLAVGLADALVAIHAAGVVHRDLKPSNILLAWDGPKVIDFGVAHLTDSSTLTRTGHVIGTLAWMSPEQMRGETSDSSADVFAWANCVTYAATGRHPFHADTPDQLALRVQRDTPDLNALPAYLLTAVSRALSKTPWQRPTAAALLAALVGREVEGVTEADAAAGNVLEQTWTGAGQAAAESVTMLPGSESYGPGPGDGGRDAAAADGWSPVVHGPGPARAPWPVGTPPPAAAFRPTLPPPTPIPPPPPLPNSRLTPLPPHPSQPPRPVRAPEEPDAARPTNPPASDSVVSRWSYDTDDPDPRAPVRHRPAPRPGPQPADDGWVDDGWADDGWVEERERRPTERTTTGSTTSAGSRPGEEAAGRDNPGEATIRPPDRAPQSRPPLPSAFAARVRPAATAGSGPAEGSGQPGATAERAAAGGPTGREAPAAAGQAGGPTSLSHPPVPARARTPARRPPPTRNTTVARITPATRVPPAAEVRPPTPVPRATSVPMPAARRLPSPPTRAALPPAPSRPAAPAPVAAGRTVHRSASDTAPRPAPGPPGAPPPARPGGPAGLLRVEGGRAGRFPPTTPPERALNGRALLSVVLALGWLFGVGSVAAVVVGSVARAQIRQHNQRGRRLATIGIGLGWTGIGLTATSLLVVLALR
ncbi:protein kinase [Frankia sp. AgB32]|uniref:protein kinase domain-containing protein n=1 Tax=Frankia sp. AgB32 TaxID=631119 RepID=UPI00200C77EA|nr:protein kinase [Frankia sp. AgB32]MCK9896379.1 protein kinase [Frankia sp. AgB32]